MKRLQRLITTTLLFASLLSVKARAQDPPIGPDEGLPHVSWHEADRVVGRMAIVSGKVQRVGHARTISFLNFDPQRRDVFKLIVREAHRDNFSKPLEELFEGKIVRVRGRVTTYRGVPQIQVTAPDQIAVLDQLPDGTPLVQPRITPRKNLTVATFNVRNLFDSLDDPYTSDEGTPAKSRSELEKIAAVIRDINADVLALQEVECRGYLRRFIDVFLPDMGYEHVVHIEGNDMRGIDVCVVTRLSVGAVTSHRHLRFADASGQQRAFNRDLLRVQILTDGQPLEIWVVHLKSNSDGREFAEPIRLGEARQIRRLLDRTFATSPDARIIVCGDFNDTADSKSVREIAGTGDMALRSFWHDVGAEDRITYNLEPYRSMIDFLFCSPAMASDYIQGSYRVRTGSLEEIGSDHNPVYAQFRTHEE